VIAAAAKTEQFDLLLTGLQSDDFGFAQTGVIAAELLGLPHATIVMDVESHEGTLRVKRELESGYFQWVSLPSPAVLTIQSGINTLRYATLKGIMASKKKEIKKLDAAALALSASDLAAGKRSRAFIFRRKQSRRRCSRARQQRSRKKLLEKLKNEARVF
jgi:electron transfer flavoprotein beta subunit